jgi:hypothetical protein
MTTYNRYCGLTLSAAPNLELPELPPAETRAAPDLTIRLGAVPDTLPNEVRRSAAFAHNGRAALWWIDGIGRFLIHGDGCRIEIEPAARSDAAALRLMLLRPVLGLASVCRGDWMLNAAAVERDGRVFAFIGPSASGKSTAAALLLRRGFRLVSDSLLRITRAPDGAWLAWPQAPWLHLWPDAIKQLAVDDSALTPVRRGLRLQRCSRPCVNEPLPLARIGLLREQRGNDLEDFVPSQRAGTRGVETLLAHTAGGTWLDELGDRRALFHWAVGLKAGVPLERLDLPWGSERLEALGAALADWCAPEGGESPAGVSQ